MEILTLDLLNGRIIEENDFCYSLLVIVSDCDSSVLLEVNITFISTIYMYIYSVQ